MNKNVLIVGVAAIILGGLGISGLVGNATNKDADTAMVKSDDESKMVATEQGDAMQKEVSPTEQVGEVMKKDAAKEVLFTSEADAQAMAKAGSKVVYFFHASWCPTCKAAQKDLDANIGNLPAGTVIVKTDYDTNKDGAVGKRYAITYQHTFVQIDVDGKQLKKWNGGGVQEIKENIV